MPTLAKNIQRVILDIMRLDGEDTNTPLPLESVDSTVKTTAAPSAGRHHLRVEVRGRAGVSELISSPLYINFPEE